MVAQLTAGVTADDLDRFVREVGCDVQEVPQLTREAIIPRPFGGPVILLPSGLSSIARRRALAAAMMCQFLEAIDWGSAVDCWREIFDAVSKARGSAPCGYGD